MYNIITYSFYLGTLYCVVSPPQDKNLMVIKNDVQNEKDGIPQVQRAVSCY